MPGNIRLTTGMWKWNSSGPVEVPCSMCRCVFLYVLALPMGELVPEAISIAIQVLLP